ncbi:MAG: glycosyltransferase [Lachnospiraceae bacterium]|nr:glycosyltransferase [Lachnospiraceae bacterium]
MSVLKKAFRKLKINATSLQLEQMQAEIQSLQETIREYKELQKQLEKQIKELTITVLRNEKRNVNNHEKYSKKIGQLIKQCDKMYPSVMEDIQQKEYEYNCSLPPELYEQELKDFYKRKNGKDVNFENPVTLSEKITWMKLNDSTELKSLLADKYRVRKWVEEKIGSQYLIPLLGTWEKFDDIDFDLLPEKFVLKCNHGSGMNVIVNDKKDFDRSTARRKINKWMNTNYAFTAGLEMHYKNIKPVILAESFLATGDQLRDYKFLCFGGKVEYVWVDSDRHTNYTRAIFDREWNVQPFRLQFPETPITPEKPEKLDEMIRIAETLSAGFSFVRVDLYYINQTVYFGEMTFTSENGSGEFSPPEYDKILGDKIKL